MLIGLDLFSKLEAKIDFKALTIEIKGEVIPLNQPQAQLKEELFPWDPGISEIPVYLKKTVKVPSLSEVMIKLKPIRKKGACLFESCINKRIYTPRSLHEGGQPMVITFANLGHQQYKIPKGTLIGKIVPIEPEKKVKTVKTEIDPERKKNIDPEKEKKLDAIVEDILKRAEPSMEKKFNEIQKERARKILYNHKEVFAIDDLDVGKVENVKHHIDTGDAAPVKEHIRRTPVQYLHTEDEIIKKMIKADIIQPSCSSWAAAPVMVKKRDGGTRYALDYRRLNMVTKRDVYPIPMMAECLDALANNVIFSKIDCNSAYHQIEVDKESRPKTAFITRHGLFEFKRLPFGLSNAGATYQRAMALILTGLTWEAVLCYLDDILVLGKTIDDHLDNLEKVLGRLKEHNLKLKGSKCVLFVEEMDFLGRKLAPDGLTLTDHSIETIRRWPVPQDPKGVQRFLGFINFHRNFVPNIAEITEPLNKLVRSEKKDGTSKHKPKKKFIWREEQQAAFDKLKEILSSPKILTIPTRDDPFVLDVDASNSSIGGHLLQIQEGIPKTIAFGSFTLSKEQRRHCTTRQELLAVVRFVQHYRHYLLGKKFKLRTDHHSLVWLFNFKKNRGAASSLAARTIEVPF